MNLALRPRRFGPKRKGRFKSYHRISKPLRSSKRSPLRTSGIVARSAGEVLKLGLTAALDLSYRRTAPFLQPYVMQEIRGLADASGTMVLGTVWLCDMTLHENDERPQSCMLHADSRARLEAPGVLPRCGI